MEGFGEGEGEETGNDNEFLWLGLEGDLFEGDDEALFVESTFPEVSPDVLHLGLLLGQPPAGHEEGMDSLQVRARLLHVSPSGCGDKRKVRGGGEHGQDACRQGVLADGAGALQALDWVATSKVDNLQYRRGHLGREELEGEVLGGDIGKEIL